MTLKERYQAVVDYFSVHMPVAETELHYTNSFELLVAVILSAQCTDKRVNMVTPALFEAFPDAHTMRKATPEQVFEYIRSISYPNNKAKALVGMATMLITRFKGVVPESIDDLTQLPGVGRKTANVIASVVYNQPAMAVDTHVMRVSKRLGLVKRSQKTPLQIERELVTHIPKALIAKAHHWLILHGRYVCKARSPQCTQCGLTVCCAWYQANLKTRRNNV